MNIKERSYKLRGIINGIDTAFYNPETDKSLFVQYNGKNLEAKAENKIKLTNIMVKELADKYGIEAVVSLLGISLSD